MDDPNPQLAAFLTALPAPVRKALEEGLYTLTQDELNQWSAWMKANPERSDTLYAEYLSLLSPAKLKEYRKREKQELNRFSRQLGNFILPKIPMGRPRLDDLATEEAQLKKTGLSYKQIEIYLNQKYGAGTTTAEKVRALLRSRRRPGSVRKTPDKT